MSKSAKKPKTTKPVPPEEDPKTPSPLLTGHVVCIDTSDWQIAGGERYQVDMRHILHDEFAKWFDDLPTACLGSYVIPNSKRHLPEPVTAVPKDDTPPPSPPPVPSAEPPSALPPVDTPAQATPAQAPKRKRAKKASALPKPDATSSAPKFVPNLTLKLRPEDVDVICVPLRPLVDHDNLYQDWLAKSSAPVMHTVLRAEYEKFVHLPKITGFPHCSIAVWSKKSEESLNARVKALTRLSPKPDNAKGFSVLCTFPFVHVMTTDPVALRLVLFRMLRLSFGILVPLVRQNSQSDAAQLIHVNWARYVVELGLTIDDETMEVSFLVRLAAFDTYAEHEFDGKCVTYSVFTGIRLPVPEDLPLVLARVSKNTVKPSVTIFHIDYAKAAMKLGLHQKLAEKIAANKPDNAIVETGDVEKALESTRDFVQLFSSAQQFLVDIDAAVAQYDESYHRSQFKPIKSKAIEFIAALLVSDASNVGKRPDDLKALIATFTTLNDELRKQAIEEEEDDEEEDDEEETMAGVEDAVPVDPNAPVVPLAVKMRAPKKKPVRKNKKKQHVLSEDEARVHHRTLIGELGTMMISIGQMLEEDVEASQRVRIGILKDNIATFMTYAHIF